MEQFQFEEGRNERISPSDAKRLVERWMANDGQATADWPSVADLAETLRTTPDEIRIMLARMRAEEATMPIVARRPWLSAQSWHVGLGIAGAISLVIAALFFALGPVGVVRTESSLEMPPTPDATFTRRVENMNPVPTTGGEIARAADAPGR
jgi:hypothetical protein